MEGPGGVASGAVAGSGGGGESSGRARSGTACGGCVLGCYGQSLAARKPGGGPRLWLRWSGARPRTPRVSIPTARWTGRVAGRHHSVSDLCPRKKAHTLALLEIMASTGSAPEEQQPAPYPAARAPP